MDELTTHTHVVRLSNEHFLKEVRKMLDEGREVTLRIRGVSMRPFLEDERDLIVLIQTGQVKVGDPVLAEIASGRYVFHRIIRIEGNSVTLRGDGNVYGTEQCSMDDIVASTKALVRKGRYHTLKDRRWRWYSALWPGNPFARRVLLAIHRRLPAKWR